VALMQIVKLVPVGGKRRSQGQKIQILKIILYDTTRSRAFIFCTFHYLEILYSCFKRKKIILSKERSQFECAYKYPGAQVYMPHK